MANRIVSGIDLVLPAIDALTTLRSNLAQTRRTMQECGPALNHIAPDRRWIMPGEQEPQQAVEQARTHRHRARDRGQRNPEMLLHHLQAVGHRFWLFGGHVGSPSRRSPHHGD
ncbi:hypothetical protein [Ramlibacter sp.]|uniref:hypothetical protein n=1 Tax=Ramlibacter sp. TaxID=1917967 RepID=UPI0017BDD207|nr:hypothetical protein [Ramlibacter sp.]MBA2673803.1 hypothetical protein [Ramlibacter sp.]